MNHSRLPIPSDMVYGEHDTEFDVDRRARSRAEEEQPGECLHQVAGDLSGLPI